MTRIPALALPYPEHLGAAQIAYSLGSWLAILHGYGPGVLHFPLGPALHTIPLHPGSPFLFVLAKHAITKSRLCQESPATVYPQAGIYLGRRFDIRCDEGFMVGFGIEASPEANIICPTSSVLSYKYFTEVHSSCILG